MTPERWRQVREIFHAALDRAVGERSAFLQDACGGDEALKKEVESLVAAHEKDGSFIDSPAYEATAELIVDEKAELKPGQVIGSYEIISFISRGGMGEVYLAQDKRLGRKVALKLLPSSVTKDAGRLQRFEQEARAASALNHPNIITIYEIREANSTLMIATEFVEGETLRQRLGYDTLDLHQSLHIAIQIADALATAHKAGIIHRDIKPENVMIRPDGYVKVLDFGLAKLIEPRSPTSISQAPTKKVKTGSGMIMGTVGYMSPEQARGQTVDARSDIFNLGAVIYEMVAGQKPFDGETPSDILAAILKSEPPLLSHFAPDAPAELVRIVTKALRKDREERYQVIKDMLLDLKSLKEEMEFQAKLDRSVAPGKSNEAPAAGSQSQRLATEKTPASTDEIKTAVSTITHSLSAEIKRHRTGAVLVVAALLVASIVGMFALYKFLHRSLPAAPASTEAPQVLRTTQITTWTGEDLYPSFSPDGNSIAYSSDHNGNFEIYVKPLAPGSREIQITSDGQQNFEPAWSPDGQYVAFYSRNRGGIWIAPPSGGTLKQLTRFGSHPKWSRDGSLIAFQSDPLTDLGAQAAPSQPPSTIWVVSANGSGDPTQITKVGNPPGGHGAPAWSADGKHIVFCVSDYGGTSIWTVGSNGNNAKQIVNYGLDPVYAPDGESIYYASLAGLSKIRVAPASGEPVGEPVQLTSGSSERTRYIAVSADGKKFAYAAVLINSNMWSAPLAHGSNAPTGNPVPLTQDRTFRNTLPAFSPDGKKIAFNTQKVDRESGAGDIWLMDADGKNVTQVTTEGGGVANWFPNGEQLAFASNRDRRQELRIVNLKTREDKHLLDFGEYVNYIRLSPDGKQIIFNSKRSGTINVWKMPIEGGEAKQLTFDKELMGFACWSPDGQTLGFEVKRGDDTNVAVLPSDGGAITQLTFGKGQAWSYSFSPDGDKIAFAGFRDGVWNVWWVSRSTKEQKQLTKYTKLNAFVRYPAWSPLGNQIVYEYAETTGNIWLMELK
jgi:eukaryotic-like serine/threonine-protein kinase